LIQGITLSEYVEDGIEKFEFVKSRDNDSYIIPKNVSQEIYEKHAMTFLRSVEDFRIECTFWYREGNGISHMFIPD
jgi:hypothetical protein